MLGIYLGALTIKYAGVSRINWIYKKPKPEDGKKRDCNEDGFLVKAVNKLRPEVLMKYDWGMFANFTRYSQVVFYIFFVLSVDALNFFLKYVLWVGAESDRLKGRVAIWAFTAIACSKEFFAFVDDPNNHRVGPFFWLACYTLAIEYSVLFKFAAG